MVFKLTKEKAQSLELIRDNKDFRRLIELEENGIDIESDDFVAGFKYAKEHG